MDNIAILVCIIRIRELSFSVSSAQRHCSAARCNTAASDIFRFFDICSKTMFAALCCVLSCDTCSLQDLKRMADVTNFSRIEVNIYCLKPLPKSFYMLLGGLL
jgi:hypothetical protein